MSKLTTVLGLLSLVSFAASCGKTKTNQSGLAHSASDTTGDSNELVAKEQTSLLADIAGNIVSIGKFDRARIVLELSSVDSSREPYLKAAPYDGNPMQMGFAKVRAGKYKLAAKIMVEKKQAIQGEALVIIEDGALVSAKIDRAPYDPQKPSLLPELLITVKKLPESSPLPSPAVLPTVLPSVTPQALPAGKLTMSPQSAYNFGYKELNKTAMSYDLTVKNIGTANASLLSFNVGINPALPDERPFAYSGSCSDSGLVLKPQESCVMRFSFSPKRLGLITGSVMVNYFDSQANKSFLVSLQGSGVPEDRAYLEASAGKAINFGCKIIGEQDKFSFSNYLYNHGVVDATNIAISIGSSVYEIVGNPGSIAAGGGASTTVSFIPKIVGKVETDAVISYFNGHEKASISLHLSGYGMASQADLQACHNAL